MLHNNLNLNDVARMKVMSIHCVHEMNVLKLGIEIIIVSVY